MPTKGEISNLLSKMSSVQDINIEMIRNTFGNLNFYDEEGQSLLHIFVDHKYDEEKCFLAIQSLLKAGISPNLESDFDYNFIQVALYTGYSESFILRIIAEALKYKLDVNHYDEDLDTMVHTAIYSDDYLGEVINIYDLLCKHGFNSTNLDCCGRNLIEAMIFQKQYSNVQIEEMSKRFVKEISPIKNDNKSEVKKKQDVKEILPIKEKQEIKEESNNYDKVFAPSVPISLVKNIPKKDLEELEKMGLILNEKEFLSSPTIGREDELVNLIITLALEKKMPLIVGESGIGKTALVHELAYRIKMGQVPSFLQGKIILEVNPNELVAGCGVVGAFEEQIKKLIDLCKKYNIIIFIDELHMAYGVGTSRNNNNDMAGMLKKYIDRTGLKVIGTTTMQNYNEYFANDDFKRRFELVKVLEPTEDILYLILEKVLNDYTAKNEIIFEKEEQKAKIIKVLIDATNKKNRVYNDIVNNPDLAISIIDKAFAFAKIYNSSFIREEHFIDSLSCCNRIYGPAKEHAIFCLRRMDNNIVKMRTRKKVVDFSSYKKR